MLKNFIITAIRNLLRNRTYTFINIFGLALGISSALVLFKFINYHKGFDKHLTHYDELYRFVRLESSANNVEHDIGMPMPFAKAFTNDYPDVGTVAMVQYARDVQLSVTNPLGDVNKFRERGGVAFVKQPFFELFDVEMIVGNKETALANPDQIILSESLVERYFGFTSTNVASALGLTVRLDNQSDLIVSGVMRDMPKSTDIPYKALVSFSAAEDIFPLFDEENWGSVSSNTNVYLLKSPEVTVESINAKLKDVITKYLPDEVGNEAYSLQPMSDVHFNTLYTNLTEDTMSRQLLWGCAITGLILILTACINFVNLATAQAVKRAKEVGVRKVLGGSRLQLTYQFMSETFVITLISVVLSLGIAELALNNLDLLLDYELTLDLMNDLSMLAYLGLIIVGVTLLAGLYPSFVLSTLNPVTAMKRSLSGRLSGKYNLRRGLVITQFFISQFLIICTLVVVVQMRHFYNADMGFTRESIVNFDMPEPGSRNAKLLRDRLAGNPNIEAMSFHLGAPLGQNNLGSNFNYEPLNSENDFDAQFKVIDSDYIDLFDIELLAGRNLSEADTSLQNAMITETVMRMIGIEDPNEAVGIKINTGFNGAKNIVGVVKDFHAHSLKSEIMPLFLIGWPNFNYRGSIKVIGDDASIQKTIKDLQREWETVFPNYTFESDIFDDSVLENYEAEADQLILFQIFSGIAIFIGCLGLYGLIAFMANQKTKEIGVRKVLGATVGQILNIFSKELVLLIGVAFLLSAPLGYYAMSQWLLDFEYNISMEVWMFAVAIAFTFIIGGITTGYRSMRAAQANPVDSLRSE